MSNFNKENQASVMSDSELLSVLREILNQPVDQDNKGSEAIGKIRERVSDANKLNNNEKNLINSPKKVIKPIVSNIESSDGKSQSEKKLDDFEKVQKMNESKSRIQDDPTDIDTSIPDNKREQSVYRIAQDLSTNIFYDTLKETNDFELSMHMYIESYYKIFDEFTNMVGKYYLPDRVDANEMLKNVEIYLKRITENL